MAQKKITLTIPEPLLNKLKQEKQKFSYNSLQEIIIDTLREKYLRNSLASKEHKRGRPPKIREENVLRRKNIFKWKGGEKFDV